MRRFLYLLKDTLGDHEHNLLRIEKHEESLEKFEGNFRKFTANFKTLKVFDVFEIHKT